MNIIERSLNDVTVLDLKGNLALEGNKQFRQHVAATIDAGARKLILNLAGGPLHGQQWAGRTHLLLYVHAKVERKRQAASPQ